MASLAVTLAVSPVATLSPGVNGPLAEPQERLHLKESLGAFGITKDDTDFVRQIADNTFYFVVKKIRQNTSG